MRHKGPSVPKEQQIDGRMVEIACEVPILSRALIKGKVRAGLALSRKPKDFAANSAAGGRKCWVC